MTRSPVKNGVFLIIKREKIYKFDVKTFTSKIKRIVKRLSQYAAFSILLVFVLLGSWCLPPKWIEKVILEIKSKYTVENVIEDDQ